MADCKNCKTIKEHTNVIYEDSVCIATLPDKGATLGHIKVFPKQHSHMLEQFNDEIAVQLLSVATQASMAVFEAVGAQGTNIIINNGISSDREHVTINIIPRKSADGLDFMWKGKQSSQDDLEKVKEKLTAHTQFLGYQAAKDPRAKQQQAPEVRTKDLPDEDEADEDDFMIRQLDRIP